MDVLLIGAISCHGRQHDTVLQGRSADADRLEQFRDGGSHIVFRFESESGSQQEVRRRV